MILYPQKDTNKNPTQINWNMIKNAIYGGCKKANKYRISSFIINYRRMYFIILYTFDISEKKKKKSKSWIDSQYKCES